MTSLPTPQQLEAAGLYDPGAPDAEERLELVALALEHGATYDEIRSGIEEHRLHAVAAERVIRAGQRITLAEAIARGGIDPAFGERVWRALGFVVAEDDAATCTEADVALFQFFVFASEIFGIEPSLALARTAGGSMARLADGAITNARSSLEAPMRTEGGTSVDIARAFIGVAATVVPRLYPMFETVHRHHLVDTARRYSLWGVAPTEEGTTEAVVGFADLVGYTALSQRLSTVELDTLVVNFEERALAAITRPGARLVKLIGDEVMFVAGDASDAIDIARRLVHDPDLPPLRVGLAAGEVVSREGDVFGPTVNLAARIVALAEPGGILLDSEAARRLGDRAQLRDLGAQDVVGFDAPIEVFAVEPAP
jgi:adenylate cyclase